MVKADESRMANADDGTMGKTKRENLRKVREQLQDMDPGQVLLKMSSICNEENVHLVFNEQDEEEILRDTDQFKRCEKFLKVLLRRGDRAYDIFRQALEEIHPHLRNILPEGEDLDERLLFSRIIRANEQFSWAIRDPGVWIIFSSIHVSGPKRVKCLKWPDCDIKDRLEEQECLVSRAIELRCDDSGENFNDLTATIALFHNVSTLRSGQEIIIKELVNYKEKGKKPVWKDLETTCSSRQSGTRVIFQKEYANLSASEEISSFMESVKRKQDENDQEIFRDDSFIQNSS
ncbi:hypothetical protein AWC38_SpisGene11239 [Stylophora pistillata]|uniref:CARD domain-containing protein n=1 Tax=Stylophora pistillata TaxID=50429 RepID=A0A2B4S544_STYPI|nr:hypothetical protein AWC38_SpisGene11239 [Stylophora pistillata]